MNKKIIILILVLIFIGLIYYKQENLENTTLNLSNEAIQNIASVYNNQNLIVSNLTTTGMINASGIKTSGDINTSGNITGNLTVSNIKAPNADTKITINSPITYADNLKPFILSILVGNYKGPIYDASQNTFSTDKYTIKKIDGSLIIGVRNNKWWVANYLGWNSWQHSILEITPIPLKDVYSSYNSFGAITTDTMIPSGWGTGPVNAGYYAYDSTGNPHYMSNPVNTSS